MIYVLTGRKNPTFIDGVFPGTFTDDTMQDSYINTLREIRPKLVVYQDIRFTEKEESRLANYARPLYEYIMKNYVPVKQFGPYQVLLRK